MRCTMEGMTSINNFKNVLLKLEWGSWKLVENS
jgi:hypothetical protein